MYQTFIKNLGIGAKGYSLLFKEKKFNYFIISGKNSNYHNLINKLKKNSNTKIGNIKLGKNRNSIDHINKISDIINTKKIDKIIVVGGGSVIDFSKRVFLKLKNRKIKLWFLPSVLGSGAESSISSIINEKFKKNIITNRNFLPDTIIYDQELTKGISDQKIILGILDSITHCIESLTTINGNYYLEFLSVMSVKSFIKKYSLIKIFNNEVEFNDQAILSFNGGLAQSNAGSGICHALAHAAEQITGENHAKCISYFLYPTLLYLSKNNKEVLNKFNIETIKYLKKFLILFKKKYNFKAIDKIFISNNVDILLSLAQKDPCWRLYRKSIDIKFLRKCLNERY